MKIGSRRTFLGATAIAVACLLGAATGQARQAQNAQDSPTMTEEVFESVVLLRGIPVDTFLEAMGMFANAMGNDCTYCHASSAPLNRSAFAEGTPRIQRARQMIVMMNTINKTYFGGEPRVTCFTCHSGNQSPRSDPNLALQYSTPVEDPNARDFPTDPTASADQVFDRYLEALGGAERLTGLSSVVATGTYSGFDTSFAKVPVEIYAKAPNQHTMLVHFSGGDSLRTYDGRNGWMAGPYTPLPLLTLSAGNLDRARLEAMLWFPAGIRDAYSEWRVGRAVLGDEEVMVVQGTDAGQPVVNLSFGESGLLVRLVRWTQTPVGSVPTQIDYADYRDVAGVRVPFRRTVSQTYMQMSIELSDVQPNVEIAASRFARPAPAPRPGA
ncbi:MAG: photosynthetic reaction center cytochrome c subunit family protein [Chloroflexi bacterium]|nr:photosynthetic reaction center cytochrome c subunit family protein [Chloroflexota bacterium]